MKKTSIAILRMLLITISTKAQTKVFKEISKDMETKVETIIQDNKLVGYLIFNKLEKISSDSFSYKLTILDENLNDLSNYSFQNQNLSLQDVAFDQDVLCIGYIRNDAPPKIDIGDFKNEIKKVKSSIYLQFVKLNGELVNEFSENVNLYFTIYDFVVAGNSFTYAKLNKDGNPKFKGVIRNPIKIKNIPNKGFSISYTESKFINGTTIKDPNDYFNARNIQNYELFNFKGERLWNIILPNSKLYFSSTIYDNNILYLLRKNKIDNINPEGGYELLCISNANGEILMQSHLKTPYGNHLKVLNFTNSIKDNNLVISGVILDKDKIDGEDVGVFSINVKDTVLSKYFSNWYGGEFNLIDNKQKNIDTEYTQIRYSFTDKNGDNFFTGLGRSKRSKQFEEVILKQNKKGNLYYYSSLKDNDSKEKFFPLDYQLKTYFTVSDSKYLVIRSKKHIYIYDIEEKRFRKTMPLKEGKSNLEIFKAKEGHIMLSEYNSEDGTTMLSIETL